MPSSLASPLLQMVAPLRSHRSPLSLLWPCFWHCVDLRFLKICTPQVILKTLDNEQMETRFRCYFKYYWASVFKVAFKPNLLEEMVQAAAEVLREALPNHCRPGVAFLWMVKERHQVNGTCSYYSAKTSESFLLQVIALRSASSSIFATASYSVKITGITKIASKLQTKLLPGGLQLQPVAIELLTTLARKELMENQMKGVTKLRRLGIPTGTYVSKIGNEDFEFISLLKDCSKEKDLLRGTKLHADILKRGMLEGNPYLASSLINMYAKCGVFSKAQEILDALPVHDIVSWNALIGGYTSQGLGYEALDCFDCMHCEGFPPDTITFTYILKACGSTGTIHKGRMIHDEIVSRDLLKRDVVLGNALIDMYVKCGLLAKAQQVLEDLPVRNVISWSALIAGYAQYEQAHKALRSFSRMRSEGFLPDAITFTCVLKACGTAKEIDKGKDIHDEIVRRRLLEEDIRLGNSLVDMYCKCGMLAKAQQVLEELPRRNASSWSTLITGCVENGEGHRSFNFFERMQSEGLSPDAVTFICILKACSSMGDTGMGQRIHEKIRNTSLLKKDIVLGTALVDMYAKCGLVAKAQMVLEEIPLRNIVSWSALIGGYAQQGQGHAALDCFGRLQGEGLFPDVVTFTCILKACGSIGAIDKGKQIHNEVINSGLLVKDIMLGTGLVDMYAKCGELTKAQVVLEELPMRDVICWNALIAGYAQQGLGFDALTCFKQMQSEGLFPDEVTCLCILSACSRSGLFDEAEILFRNMHKKYGVTPKIQHYTCMVMILGCAGDFDKALSIIQVMPSSDHPAVWLAILGACRKWENVKLGRLVFDQVLQLDESCIAAYVLMSNTFAAAGLQQDAEKIETMRLKYTTIVKHAISVWVDESGNVHSFSLGDNKNSRNKKLNEKSDAIIKKISGKGFIPTTLYEKSEILAVVCALLNVSQDETIHVMNSMPISDDCHKAICIISGTEKRKVILKDPECFHMFENGKCVCRKQRTVASNISCF